MKGRQLVCPGYRPYSRLSPDMQLGLNLCYYANLFSYLTVNLVVANIDYAPRNFTVQPPHPAAFYAKALV